LVLRAALRSSGCIRPGRRLAVAGLCGIALGALPLPGLAGPREVQVAGTRFDQIYERRPDGQFTGLGVELLQMFAERYGYSLRFELYPWRRAQELTRMGKADVLVGPYKSAERQRAMRFCDQAFFQDEVLFYAKADSVPLWEGDYAALGGKRIVTLNGWNYGPAFGAAAAALNISVANTVENGLLMLMQHHVELFASDRRDTEPVIAALAPLIDVQRAYFAFPLAPRYAEMPAQMDALLLELKSRGELQKLARRYHVSPP